LPEVVATPGHHLYIARNSDRKVGMVRFAERAHGADRVACLYDIEVDADLRGQGLGEALARAMEPEARSAGLKAVRLQVFGNNSVARSLYRKPGYIETSVVMAEDLDRRTQTRTPARRRRRQPAKWVRLSASSLRWVVGLWDTGGVVDSVSRLK
jgi:ribosomal protein S18 acetylase RimI-like enzyme